MNSLSTDITTSKVKADFLFFKLLLSKGMGNFERIETFTFLTCIHIFQEDMIKQDFKVTVSEWGTHLCL